MSSQPSHPAVRVMTLQPGKSCVVARNPRGLIATALKYTQAKYSAYRVEGQFVIKRLA